MFIVNEFVRSSSSLSYSSLSISITRDKKATARENITTLPEGQNAF